MTTVHAQPAYQIRPVGDSPHDYPDKAHPDVYQQAPDGTTFQQRRAAFIDHVLKNPAPANTKPVWYELIRMAGGNQAHEGVFHKALDFIDARKDCADFVHHGILRLLYQFDPRRRNLKLAHPPSGGLLLRARETTLNFKYFPDEPGLDSMCTWTENHYILFTSAGYLAGQMFPNTTFSNSGETGQHKMERNRPRILRWLDMRFRSGFNEWLSHVYYDEDLTALLSLYDFCEDNEIHKRAEMVLDLLLLDMALNSFQGVFGSSHGRSYENSKKWASNEGTIGTMKLLFGMGVYSAFDNMSAAAFAMSSYRVPPAITRISQDTDRVFINRQRMGFKVQDAEKWGLAYDDVESGMIFLTNEAYLHPKTAALTLKMFDKFRWWENEFFSDFKANKGFLKTLLALNLVKPITRFLERDICRNMRDEPNIYTYKTPDYMLSTAQDHRKGFGGDQQHIWQATLGPNAVCFSTHPGRVDGATPNYWGGSGLLPRAVQVRNLTICIYNIEKLFLALYVQIRNFYTHAWLPKDQFDEWVEKKGWIFARKNAGYLALYSQQPYVWNEEGLQIEGHLIRKNAEDFGREIIALGKQNIWICQMGRKAEDGAFADFVQSILDAKIIINGLKVEFHSPGNGVVKFAWEGPLTVDGEVINLANYPRYANPYVQAEFDPSEIDVEVNGEELVLNWETGNRQIRSAVPPKAAAYAAAAAAPASVQGSG